MSRYKIALGKKPSEEIEEIEERIELEEPNKKDIYLGFKQAYFTNIKVMTDSIASLAALTIVSVAG